MRILITLTESTCKSCQRRYAIDKAYREGNDKSGRPLQWYCPYCGAPWIRADKTEAEEERELRIAAESRLASEQARHDQTKADRDFHERSARAHKAQKKSILRRVHAGVCPHCKRNFKNLAQHMETKHSATTARHGRRRN